MCRHEICMERKFNIEKCDIQHHYREQVTLSYNIKPQIEYFHRENKTIMTTLLQTMEESESGCIIEHSGNQRTQNNEEFNNEEDNNCNFEMDDNVGNDDIEDEINDDSDTRHLNIKSFLPQKSIKNINNEIFNYYQKASVENKEAMSAMLILVRDFLKTRGNTKQCTKISTDNNIQRIQLQNIVQCYNSAFMEGNNAFDNSKMIIPNQQSLMKKHKKRIQPTHEIQRRKAKKRITNKATCSFCGYEGHQTSTCPTRSELEAKYRKITDKYSFLEYLRNDVLILDPDDELEVITDIVERTHHLVIHREIYAKKQNLDGYYSGMSLNEMLFTISLLSKDNGSVIHDRIVVNGEDIESYIHQTIKIHTRLIFDDTRIYGICNKKFHQRKIFLSQTSDNNTQNINE